MLTRARGVLILIGAVVILLALGFGLAKLIALPFGGVGTLGGRVLGLLIVWPPWACSPCSAAGARPRPRPARRRVSAVTVALPITTGCSGCRALAGSPSSPMC